MHFVMNSKRKEVASGAEYDLALANGVGWHIRAARGAQVWLKKMATIMELKDPKSDHYPNLLVFRGGSTPAEIEGIVRGFSGIRKDLPARGWVVHDLGRIRYLSHGEVEDMICAIGDEEGEEMEFEAMQEFLIPVYEGTIESGGLLIHAALMEREGKGVILGGPGGRGKSTCCRRIPEPWHARCDDLTLLVEDHEKRYQAHPFPTWSDYLSKRSAGTWDVQNHVQLSAIFILEQSGHDEVVPVGQSEAAIMITKLATQIYRRDWWRTKEEVRERKIRIFTNAGQLARNVPAFILRISREGQFWKEMEKVLK